jgi:UPF0755 protein
MGSYYIGKLGHQTNKKRKRKVIRRLLFFLFLFIVLPLFIVTLLVYKTCFRSNVWIREGVACSVYIPTDATFQNVKTLLYGQGLIINRRTFEWYARFRRYDHHIKPGRYILLPRMSNSILVQLLNSGEQTPVKVVINDFHGKEDLARAIAKQIEADSASLMSLMNDSAYLSHFGFSPHTILMMFIPNTYEFYWNTNADWFFERMCKEYNLFWNDDRVKKLNETGLTKEQVIILASIVEKETNQNDEKPRIAGVYMNRLQRGWLLQADPTIVYALGDPSVHRVLNIHKDIESPYNTYKHGGLPPGPICIPSIASVDGVLNYERNNYMYFCGRDDFSGYHVFSTNYLQHLVNARKYQKALDRQDIRK